MTHHHHHHHEHEHEHEHEHGHEHEHEHGHGHEHKSFSLPALEKKPGRMLFVDAFSGVSGDMFISGMLGLGVPLSVVQSAVSALPLTGYRLEQGVRSRSGIAAASFDVVVEGDQPHRTWRDMDEMLAHADLPGGTGQRARHLPASRRSRRTSARHLSRRRTLP